MTDITTTNLEAAILDQKVAGEFRGKRYCFIATRHGDQYILGVAVQGERGYNPIRGKAFITQAQATEWANGLNEHLGLTVEQATSIVISTMHRRSV